MAAARQDSFKAEVRQAARNIWQAVTELRRLRAEADALDYGSTLEPADGEPTPAEILAVTYATGQALDATLAAGHATNIAKLL